MRTIKTKMITRTAILLALTIVFQLMGRFLGEINNFVVGPLVNAILLVATAMTGLWGGTAIAVIAPFVSALTNKAVMAPVILQFSPFIALGNFILVLCFYLLRKKSQIAGVIVGAVLKFAGLFTAITLFTKALSINPKIATVLTTLFSWPQLLTALLGGVIALIVIKSLKKIID